MATSSSLRPVESLQPLIVAANVRGALDTSRYVVGPGAGQIGHLVVGRVMPTPGQQMVIIDQDRHPHTIADPTRVIAVLGARDSSTHVCAIIPSGGLDVEDGTSVHWVAGESGIVGCLEREPPTSAIHAAETAAGFVCDGLLFDSEQQPVNIEQFAVAPEIDSVSTPIVMVAATSAESGKTVLSGKIISRLTESGVRVGALKVTGTGGVLDSRHHKQCGAVAVLDSVDAGMINTYTDIDRFRRRIPLIFRHIQGAGIDVIVAELGGDLLSANNPEVFGIEELMDNAILLLVISNDAVAAAGVNALNDARFGFPPSKMRHFTSPFRNHAGMSRRMALAEIDQCYDPHSPDDLAAIASEIIDCLSIGRPDPT